MLYYTFINGWRQIQTQDNCRKIACSDSGYNFPSVIVELKQKVVFFPPGHCPWITVEQMEQEKNYPAEEPAGCWCKRQRQQMLDGVTAKNREIEIYNLVTWSSPATHF